MVPEETRYLWCGSTVCESRNGSDAVTADFFQDGELRGTQALYYVRDQLGSVIAVTAGTGRVLGAARYDAYGNLVACRGTQPAFGFAGMLRDASTGLNLTLFREYDPAIGRWLSRDPIGEAGGINLYAYVLGNPLRWADPLGLWPCGYDPTTGGLTPQAQQALDAWNEALQNAANDRAAGNYEQATIDDQQAAYFQALYSSLLCQGPSPGAAPPRVVLQQPSNPEPQIPLPDIPDINIQ